MVLLVPCTKTSSSFISCIKHKCFTLERLHSISAQRDLQVVSSIVLVGLRRATRPRLTREGGGRGGRRAGRAAGGEGPRDRRGVRDNH